MVCWSDKRVWAVPNAAISREEGALPLIQIFSREEAQASSPQYAHYTHTMAFTRHPDTDILGPHT